MTSWVSSQPASVCDRASPKTTPLSTPSFLPPAVCACVLHGPHRSRRRRELSCGWGGTLVSHTPARTRAPAQSPGSTPSRRRVDVASPPATPVSDKARPQRFVGLDVHREYVVVAAVAADQQLVLPPRRLALDRFAQWGAEHLAPTDAVVLEATTNAWEFYDQLQPLVASVTIAHPYLVKLVVATRGKTDSREPVNLARLFSPALIP